VNVTLESNEVNSASQDRARLRTSDVLRAILTKNPDLETFTIERILASIGEQRVEQAWLTLALPTLVPVPHPRAAAWLPTGALAAQVAAGREPLQLPGFVLRMTVSRKSLAVAIHAILPILEAAERVVRPRWRWVQHPIARRAIATLIFLLAVAIAYPLVGFDALHALSVFVLSLGMAEQDGLAVLIGVVAGVTSLAIVAAAGWSPRALRAKVGQLLRKMAKKLGLHALASKLERHGYPRMAAILRFEWSDLLMRWDPERRAAARKLTVEVSRRHVAAPVSIAQRRARRAGFKPASSPAAQLAPKRLAHG
jgi:hypothetical protein